MSIHGKGLNYLWDGAAVETWNSTGNNSAKVTLYDASGSAIGATTNPVIVAPDYLVESGYAAAPDPGDWESNTASAPTSVDYDITDTNDHYIAIPMIVSGWTSVSLGVRCTSALDQALTLTGYSANGASANKTNSAFVTLFTVTIPASATSRAIFQAGGSGQGATTGGATVGTNSFYQVDALAHPIKYLLLKFVAGSAPSAGALTIYANRTKR